MLKSTAPVRIPIFALNKSSPFWEQAECEVEQSYWSLLLGPGYSFGLVMGKSMFWVCVKEPVKEQWAVLLWMGACGALEGAELLMQNWEIPPLCPETRAHGSGLARGITLPWHCWHLCKPQVRGPRVSHQNWDSWQSSFLCRLCEMHTIPQSLQAQLQTKQRWQEWHSLANYSVVPSVYLVLCHQLQPAFF